MPPVIIWELISENRKIAINDYSAEPGRAAHRQDLVVEDGPARLIFPHHLRLELAVAIPGRGDPLPRSRPLMSARVTPFPLFPLLAPVGSCFS